MDLILIPIQKEKRDSDVGLIISKELFEKQDCKIYVKGSVSTRNSFTSSMPLTEIEVNDKRSKASI